MIRLLKAFADWLDRRYPPQKRFTQEIWNDIHTKINNFMDVVSHNDVRLMQCQERVKQLEDSVAAIKDLLAKNGANILKPEAQKLRDEFIAFPERFNMTGTNATK